jgi:multisubunit Na+/H+ antiporter MnhG subunit
MIRHLIGLAACALLLNGCIIIPVAAMLIAKIAYESHKDARCDRVDRRCE